MAAGPEEGLLRVLALLEKRKKRVCSRHPEGRSALNKGGGAGGWGGGRRGRPNNDGLPLIKRHSEAADAFSSENRVSNSRSERTEIVLVLRRVQEVMVWMVVCWV